MESIARKYMMTAEEVIKNNTHISGALSAHTLIYLPGLKPPVVTPILTTKQDREKNLEQTFTYTFHLFNPK